MARTIQNNANDLKTIKNNLALFLVDYFKNNLNIQSNQDINILTIQKSAIFDKLKKDIETYLYNNNQFKSDFDYSLSYQLKHNNDFDITSDLQGIFEKAYKEQLKAIKEQQKATEQITINYYLADKLASELKRLIDYTKRRHKTTTTGAIEIVKSDEVMQGLFEDIKEELKAFTGDNLNNDRLIQLYKQEYKKALKHIKEQTPKEKSKKQTSLLDAFLLLRKW